jgi:alpha-mannosidase
MTYKPIFLTIALVACFHSFNLLAQQPEPKRLYLGNDTHVDLMYNGTEEKWTEHILAMADFYLNRGEETIKEEARKRSKWNYDCAYWLYVLERKMPPEYFNRIIAQIKNQQASVPYNFTLPIYGASTAESVLRSFYYGGYLERKFGIDVDIAVCQENATIPLGLSSLWAGSGAKYSWKGVCNCASKTATKGLRKHEIYWYTGLDSSKILMKWYSNFGWNAELGGYAEMLEPTIAVMQMDTLCDSKRYPYRIAGAFGKGWDNMINYAYDLQWGIGHRTRPGTKLFLSNELDFFQDFENTYGNQLPSETVAYGNEWDLLPATLMNVSGGIRRAMEKLRNAEALASIVVSHEPNAFDNLKAQKADFLYAMSVISAHGWTTDGPVKKPEFVVWARKQQAKVETYVDALHKQASAWLANKIVTVAGKKRFFVFNPLNWERTDFADIVLPEGKSIVVKDIETNKIVGHQMFKKEGKTYLKILAEKIPSVGYKVFEIDEIAKPTPSVSAFIFKDKTLETPFYKVKITGEGVLTSLIEKQTGREWAKNIEGRYLNDLGSGMTDKGTISIENRGDVSITLLCESDFPLKHKTRLMFYKTLQRIDIQNNILQNFNDPTHFSFSFNVNNPDVWHEELGAVIKAKTTPEGGHYSDFMARYDYQTLNHFADVTGNEGGIILSNLDCLFMKLGSSTTEKLDSKSSQINILAGGQVDKNFKLGIINQGGDSIFYQHFALLPHSKSYDQTEAMRMALEHQNPFSTTFIEAQSSILPEKAYSFLKTTNDKTLLWSLKPAEDGGVLARSWSMSSLKSVTNFSFVKPVSKAVETTHVETEIAPLELKNNGVNFGFNQQQMKSFKVIF